MLRKALLFSITTFFAFAAKTNTNSFNQDMLKRHNHWRTKHGVPALEWNADVAKVAQDWANTIARADNMRHRQPNKYGENIFWISGRTPTGNDVVDAWYNEIKDYNYNRPGFSMKVGHFTQVVWKDTTQIGCGSARSATGGIYVVCNYNPPGNYSGRFPANVLRPRTR
ncbi:MAG TPA: CAP family protein [Turneriella sp.]|nr:CAP family protein [Turneriella sp.]